MNGITEETCRSAMAGLLAIATHFLKLHVRASVLPHDLDAVQQQLYSVTDADPWDEKRASMYRDLWALPRVQEAFNRPHRYTNVRDYVSSKYILDRIEQVSNGF